ncbi:carboxylating nicotinate-nucleotide diphosphorylase [Alicyclobacillaceae bacterium I2511]|nr:carboxylating nicotinate-nucleotide diphosphorylase [Alicyclobacillaceae bacterium I2511]
MAIFITQGVQSLLALALAEDIGRGDWTSEWMIPQDLTATATVWLKQAGVVAGVPVLARVYRELEPAIQVIPLVAEGVEVSESTPICRVLGPARALLTGERVGLNFVARLSGIASQTRQAVQRLAGTGVQLLDTRKTTPGWRDLEKYAVRMGGGRNHRFGLDDMILIKDNHIALAGGIQAAVSQVRRQAALSQRIEVEVDTLEQLAEALDSGVHLILLDNMDTPTLKKAVDLTQGRVPLEASGNMNLDRLLEVAATGVDYISMGGLTHGAVSLDVGLEVVVWDSANLDSVHPQATHVGGCERGVNDDAARGL